MVFGFSLSPEHWRQIHLDAYFIRQQDKPHSKSKSNGPLSARTIFLFLGKTPKAGKKNIKVFRLLSLVRCRVTCFNSVLSGYLKKQIRPAASNTSKLEHQGCWLGLYLFVSISVYFLDSLFLTAQTVPHQRNKQLKCDIKTLCVYT